MKTIDLIKMMPPTGLALTATFSGTGAGTAKLFSYGYIVVRTTTTQASGSTITITTPVSFRILDMFSIHSDTVTYKWTLKNDSSDVIPEVEVLGNDNDIDRAIKIDNGEYEFLIDDDDLVISLDGTGAGLAEYYIKIQFI